MAKVCRFLVLSGLLLSSLAVGEHDYSSPSKDEAGREAPKSPSRFDELVTQLLPPTGPDKTLEDFFCGLPYEFQTNYVKMFESRGVQKGSFENPRIISYDSDAKLVFSFTGDPKAPGGKLMEVMEFDDQTNTFQAI